MLKKEAEGSTMISTTFEEKKLEEEFIEREDLLGLN
jgi:hypothetical protein